jgi:DNA-binding response OmpR family regulator
MVTSRVMSEPSLPLEGENIETTHWEDARHWMSIYADLLEFKRGLLDRIRRDVAKLSPVARAAAGRDVRIIEMQMEGYQQRLELWYQRVWDLHGLWLDPKGRTIHYRAETATLTEREFQLLQFLLEHPHRYFSVAQILGQAWANPSLFPEEVRTYIRRLRKLMAALQVPCDIVNQPQRGYCLRFREDE